jgi:hypothetical protein
MAGRQGPETALALKMRKAGIAKYGARFRPVKYVGCLGAETGVSDLLVCMDGLFVACEVKSPESSTHKRKTLAASIEHALTVGPTVKQREYVREILASGGCAGFAATVEQFLDMLEHAADMAAGDVPRPCWGHNMNGPDT